MKNSKKSLANYLDYLQSRGRYTFTRQEALSTIGCSYNAFRFSALRLIKKKRLARPKQSFYVIVPTEYIEEGIPPVTWFIDTLMKFYKQPYYVGLLSAAALHGAAHQQPQVFQIITNKPLRTIEIGRSRIQFFTKKQIRTTNYQLMKTPTGYMQVSYPEVTALDLIRHIKSAGFLNNITTVLNELQECFDEKRFKLIFKTEQLEIPDVQRLGYLLELIDTKSEIISLLKKWLQDKKIRVIPLRSDKSFEKTKRNMFWNLYINEKIETDI